MLNKLILGLALGASSTLLAQTTGIQAPPASGGYAQDGNGTVLRSSDGLCWRSGSWTPDASITGCDGALVPPIAKPIAPEIATTPAVAAQPAPIPVVATRCDFTVTLQGNLLFGFNQAALSTTAKSRIDNDVLTRLDTCASIDSILVAGHSDRLGTAVYNEKLSARRAMTIASYLKSQGVSTLIETRGLGATQPLKACDDKLGRKKLVDCLAPNRRVVIHVRGIAK